MEILRTDLFEGSNKLRENTIYKFIKVRGTAREEGLDDFTKEKASMLSNRLVEFQIKEDMSTLLE